MSDCCIVHGFIEEATNDEQVRQWSDEAIATRPMVDAWPPFARPMLTVTGSDLNGSSGSMRGERLILVGGSINYLYDDLMPWLDKFESFLRLIAWREAELFLQLGCIGEVRLNYRGRSPMECRGSSWTPVKVTAWSLRCLDFDRGNCRNDGIVDMISQRPGYTKALWNRAD